MPNWSDHSSTRKGRFWGGKDFEDAQEYTLTIKGWEDIDLPKFNNRDETETTLCLHFKQDDRILAVRTMRGKALVRLFGDDYDKWRNKHVTLFGQETGKGLAPMVRKAAFTPHAEGPVSEFGDQDDYPEHFKDATETEEFRPVAKTRGKKAAAKVEELAIEPEEQEIVDEANANLAAAHDKVRDGAARKARRDARNAAEQDGNAQWDDDEDEIEEEEDFSDYMGTGDEDIAALEAKLAAAKAKATGKTKQ
jgi:hypothetical protein